MDTDRAVAATPPCRKCPKSGPAQPGSLSRTSPTVSAVSTTKSCCRYWQRTFTMAGSCGCCETCYKPDIWRTGLSTPHCPVYRKAVWLSPILSNIYLHKLDTFVETILIPEYTRGKNRARNPAYEKIQSAYTYARRRGKRATA